MIRRLLFGGKRTAMNGNGHSRVLVIHFGGLGDLVLLSELVGNLKNHHPHGRVTLVCRSEFAAVPSLFRVPPDEVIGVDLNPYTVDHPSETVQRTLEAIIQRFQPLRVDLLVDASLVPTWLTYFLASLVRPSGSIICAIPQESGPMLAVALKRYGLPRPEFTDLGPPPEIGERERYGLLLHHLQIPRAALFPWELSKQQDRAARQWLDANGLAPGSFVVCFPGAGVPIKRWPAADFIYTLDSIRREGLPVMLLGSPAEREAMDAIAKGLHGEPSSVPCCDSPDLPLVAGILSKAAAYLGNDTGPAHLAQAYGTPGVAIFGGGGEWPRYAPWAQGSVGVVHPLPCFGCHWDCFLGHGLCVDSIPPEAVTKAMLSVLKGAARQPIESMQTIDPGMFPMITVASARYQSAQRDRAERLKVIIELHDANERMRTTKVRWAAGPFGS
jgi:ADP-heptose:LPS heptosyltransferase